MVTHSLNMLEKNLVYPGDSSPRNFTTNRVKRRSIKSEDPMSHRIIEKRRRDRMNNCLADLSRLIPPEYLKKGRGRIEKTEIIEMAIKHIGHLQNVIASTRYNENSNSGSIPSPPVQSGMLARESAALSSLDQPVNLKHYKMGYLECMSEAMHFLVEVQGYFAGDSLCVQMINHLRKHCDKMVMNGNTFNFPKKQPPGGGVTSEGARSEDSSSPINGAILNGSPPLGMSHSAGSPSDDNQPHHDYPMEEFYSPKRYLDLCCGFKTHSDTCYPKYVESDGLESESRSDAEPQSNVIVKCLPEERTCEPETHCHRNYHVLTGFGYAIPADSEIVPIKNENGPSQLREMLTSTTSASEQTMKEETSPGLLGNSHSAHEITSSESNNSFKSCASTGVKPSGDESSETTPPNPDLNHHGIMYKFKNNIKQRFSKEKRESEECEPTVSAKKSRGEECRKCEDSLMKERLSLLDRTDVEIHKLNSVELKPRYSLEGDYSSGNPLNRLNFGHRTNERGSGRRRWEDSGYHHLQKPWTSLSPPGSLSLYGLSGPCKPYNSEREFGPVINNTMDGLSGPSIDSGPGIPIFALHAKGSFYIPLTLDQASLGPFLTILGLSKGPGHESAEEKRVLHPVTISVNFHSHLIR